MRTCPCGADLPAAGRGRLPTYCSTRCRVAAHRARHADPLPLVLRSLPRWTRRDGKRPITVTGRPASSTNPATWSTYREARASTAGDGLGIMLGDGLACWDLDHCLGGGGLTAGAAEVLAAVASPLWIERSMSGRGLHVFVADPEAPGRRADGVEFYSRSRFIVVTGDRFIG